MFTEQEKKVLLKRPMKEKEVLNQLKKLTQKLDKFIEKLEQKNDNSK